MPVTVEQVRRQIEAGMDSLCALTPVPDDMVLLWSQLHPDGPDWAVPQEQFLAWQAQQAQQAQQADRLGDGHTPPTLSVALNVAVNAAKGIVALSARRGSAAVSHQRGATSHGTLRIVVKAPAHTESSLREEIFTIAPDGSDRAQVIAAAARSYVSIARQLFTSHR